MVHGGDIYTEGKLKGQELIDFSSNINPLGVPESFKNSLDEALKNVVNYPDIKYRMVREALSRYESINEELFLLGNGAAEIIDLSISTLKSILIPAPSFAEYHLSAEKWGVETQYFQMEQKKNEDGTYSLYIDYEKLNKDLEGVDGVILANPNNPDGSVLNKECIRKILEYCEKAGKKVIIDEAFIHFTLLKDQSLVKWVNEFSCLLVIKALTKYYGMPGIRFGYGITSSKELRDEISKKQNPWNINTFAVEAVKSVLFDEDYNSKSIEWLENTRAPFIKRLMEYSIFNKVYRTYGNYVLCELNGITSKEFYDTCLKRGFLIRNADNYRGLSNYHIRLAIKDEDRNNKLFEMLKSI
ncbi:pyridoxal phosphate-dependent aminotransferase [Oceanirhabdus sp. W0125-5]|uniref:pyridoxal phosphate-dependent aminotransferase n=1 Tax=Oceanirhabdus sp. W0125-5 TaxID=2999116 RepID=UPI0022F2C624|nr:histidinol-phosphate transaminase [Oceanirhabdus sp. W0125-5]WBW96191.1 histidinol-phosphate transaminase [Oceanirhabdus sp. W0125-5]